MTTSFDLAIDALETNNIDVPRFRGCSAMSVEKPKVIDQELIDNVTYTIVESAILDRYMFRSFSPWGGHWYSPKVRFWENRYLDRKNRKVKWHMLERDGRLNRKRRKEIKIHIKNELRKYQKQYDVFNKYVGRKDVVCIGARIGGLNWNTYYEDVIHEPWFIEKCDDAWDNTYCDIYAKVENRGDSAS